MCFSTKQIILLSVILLQFYALFLYKGQATPQEIHQYHATVEQVG